jgi:hypothetical protein
MNLTMRVIITGLLIAASTTIANARPRSHAAPSAIACENWAYNYARRTSREGEILGGTALGSAAGFGIGSIFAASGVGAAIGAGIGIIGGIIIREQRYEELYRAAYIDCMAGRAI